MPELSCFFLIPNFLFSFSAQPGSERTQMHDLRSFFLSFTVLQRKKKGNGAKTTGLGSIKPIRSHADEAGGFSIPVSNLLNLCYT